MSYSHTRRKKALKRSRTGEEKAVASDIRKGRMPTRFFVKSGDSRLERNAKGKLTWATKSTFHELTKKEET